MLKARAAEPIGGAFLLFSVDLVAPTEVCFRGKSGSTTDIALTAVRDPLQTSDELDRIERRRVGSGAAMAQFETWFE